MDYLLLVYKDEYGASPGSSKRHSPQGLRGHEESPGKKAAG